MKHGRKFSSPEKSGFSRTPGSFCVSPFLLPSNMHSSFPFSPPLKFTQKNILKPENLWWKLSYLITGRQWNRRHNIRNHPTLQQRDRTNQYRVSTGYRADKFTKKIVFKWRKITHIQNILHEYSENISRMLLILAGRSARRRNYWRMFSYLIYWLVVCVRHIGLRGLRDVTELRGLQTPL